MYVYVYIYYIRMYLPLNRRPVSDPSPPIIVDRSCPFHRGCCAELYSSARVVTVHPFTEILNDSNKDTHPAHSPRFSEHVQKQELIPTHPRFLPRHWWCATADPGCLPLRAAALEAATGGQAPWTADAVAHHRVAALRVGALGVWGATLGVQAIGKPLQVVKQG